MWVQRIQTQVLRLAQLSPLPSPEPLKFKEVYTGERVTQIRTNDRGEVNLLLLPEIGLIPLVYWPFCLATGESQQAN